MIAILIYKVIENKFISDLKRKRKYKMNLSDIHLNEEMFDEQETFYFANLYTVINIVVIISGIFGMKLNLIFKSKRF